MALHTHYPSRSQSLLLGAGLAILGLAGRKLMVQAPTMLAGDWDKALATEHNAALALFDGLAATDDAASGRRRMMLMQLKHPLGKHALEEENAIYPAMREHGMKAEADALNGEHGYVKQYLYELSDLLDDNPAFQQKLAKFRADIERHMKQEEQELFPRLRQALDDTATGRLTWRMNQEGLKLA